MTYSAIPAGEEDPPQSLTHSAADSAIVGVQLGRAPRGAWRVARRCHLGVPMVIENYPRLPDGAPFPTLLWLTCPILTKTVSRLEAAGTMAQMTRTLAKDEGLRARFAHALARYRGRRDALEVVEDRGAPPGGGPDRVKCLHAHVAHELADPSNPIGARALAGAGWPACRVPCVTLEPCE